MPENKIKGEKRMSTEAKIREIDAEIAQLENELSNVKGSATEVYSRIVGYYRAVGNWNKGKREEFKHRVCFDVESSENKEIVAEEDNDLQKARPKLLSKLKEFGVDVISNIITNVLTNPTIWERF